MRRSVNGQLQGVTVYFNIAVLNNVPRYSSFEYSVDFGQQNVNIDRLLDKIIRPQNKTVELWEEE